MRLLNNLLIFCIICYTYGRPLQKDESESGINDLEFEDDDETAADAFNDERNKQQEPRNEEYSDQSQEMLSENSYQESNADEESSLNTDANLISENKPVDKSNSNPEKYSEMLNYDEKIKLRSNRERSNRYIENNDLNQQVEPVDNFLNRHFKICKDNQVGDPQNKRTIKALVDESIKNNKQVNNYDNVPRINNKDFERSNTFRRYGNEHKRIDSEIERNIFNRDRRNVQETKLDSEEPSRNKNEYLPSSGNEKEELTIKKHIARLSDSELDELLNSLSEEKRELLKKIMDDDNVNNVVGDSIDKREITKKAGAVEDTNFIESVQSDVKLESSNPSADLNTESSGPHNTDTTTLTTKTENSEKAAESTTKNVETNSDSETKSDLTSRSNEISKTMLDNNYNSDRDVKNEADVTNNRETAVKSEAKRETNWNNIKNVDTSLGNAKLSENNYYNDKDEPDISFSDEYNICPQYENIAQMNEGQVQSNNEKSYKREVKEKQNEIFDSIKALEESFPDTKSIGVTSSNSGPLIRVKRTDLSNRNKAKMLAAQIMPESIRGYYPQRTENVDEEEEEGSEFDDDVFYGRTSNFKSKNKRDNVALNNNFKSDDLNTDVNLISDNINTVSINENNEKETMKLGSDNDNVLSGVEGVDENLMFSSNFRKRRNLDVNIDNNVEDNTPAHSTTFTNKELRPISN